jgi:hypothetical protein
LYRGELPKILYQQTPVTYDLAQKSRRS